MADENPLDRQNRTTVRRRFADVLRKHRAAGMPRKEMLKTSFEDLLVGDGSASALDDIERGYLGFGDKSLGFTTSADHAGVGDFINKLYSGRMDSAGDRQRGRQKERQDFAKQQKSRKLDREAAFVDKMNRQRKKSAAKFGGKMGDGPDTPGLARYDAMQKAEFGTSTAHAGEIAKGVGQQSRRTVTPRSAAFGAEARAHERAGNKAAAVQARAAQFAERRGEPNIRMQAEKKKERKHGRDARARMLEDKKAREADAAEARAEAERNR